MRSGRLVAFVLSLAWFPHSSAVAQAPDAKPDLGANAALKYWQAFAHLPSLDNKEEKLLEECNKVRLDAAALTLITRSQLSRAYLHRGVKLPHCDWSLDYSEEGWRLLLPHLRKVRTLARLTVLAARHELEQGHWQAGAEDVTALLKLARHIQMDQMPLPNLVGYSIETMAIEAAAPYLPELKQVLPEAASAVLAAPPAGPTLAQMVLIEKQIMPIWFIHELKKAEQRKPGAWQDVWKEVFNSPEGRDREFREAAKTLEQATKLVEDSLPYYDRLAKVMALPWKEVDAQLPEFFKKTKADNPLASYFLPAMDKVVAAQRRAQTQMALFKAALAVVQGGPDKLKDVKDPFGEPFEYRALDKGFELKSKLRYADKPVTLTVGQRKKE
jgi:hypothetical protein